MKTIEKFTPQITRGETGELLYANITGIPHGETVHMEMKVNDFIADVELSYYAGKVRDLIKVRAKDKGGRPISDFAVVSVADRFSAKDQRIQNGVPGQGPILNMITYFWKQILVKEFGSIGVRNDLMDIKNLRSISEEVAKKIFDQMTGLSDELQILDEEKRISIVRLMDLVPAEVIVRKCISAKSSIAKDYDPITGLAKGYQFPKDLELSDELIEIDFPIMTPSSKGNAWGFGNPDKPNADVNWTFEEAVKYMDQYGESMKKKGFYTYLDKQMAIIYSHMYELYNKVGLKYLDDKKEVAFINNVNVLDNVVAKESFIYLVDEIGTQHCARILDKNGRSLSKDDVRAEIGRQMEEGKETFIMPDRIIEGSVENNKIVGRAILELARMMGIDLSEYEKVVSL